MRILLSSLAALTLLGVQIFAQAPSVDDQAKFLAGLPMRGTPLEELSRIHAWGEHAAAFDDAWKKLASRQLDPIKVWQAEFLTSSEHRPLLYFFSGPDILYAHAFFPEAPTYILCGIEPVGALPEVEKLSKENLAISLQMLRQSLDSVLSWSFFITKNMKTDLERNKLQGTVPILYLFLARHGCHLEEARLVGIDRSGALVEGKAANPGVKITFTRPGQSTPQTLYYFSSDLSDGPASNSGFLKWCATLGPSDSFLKSASYLMHLNGFDTVRKFLLEQSSLILADDSGIPIKFFQSQTWSPRLFGAYPGPIELFKEHNQPDLAELYRRSHPPSLAFGFGYRWRAPESTLILATKKVSPPSATPAEPLPPAPTVPPPAAETKAE